MTIHIRCVRVLVAVFGMGLLLGPVSVAHADMGRCAVPDTRDFVVSVDPPFTLPYERPDGPLGSAINW